MRPYVTARRAIVPLVTALASLACAAACNSAQGDPSDTTGGGSKLRIIVGFRVGGPYDLHARILAKHLGSYLPGHPDIIVENMPGASGRMAVKHLATLTKKDGLTIGLLSHTSAADLVESNLLGDFDILGSPGPPPQLVLFSARSGITTVDAWRRAPKPPRFGSNGPPTPPYVEPLIAAAALGLPIQMVPGYANSADVRLAIEVGEVDAVSVSLDAYHTAYRAADVRAVLRFSAAPIPGFDAPDAMSIAPDARARELLETGIYMMAPMVRFYVVPRGTPAARVASLREALEKTWVDPRFLADARAAGLSIDPVTAFALEQTVATLAARPATLRDLRSILQPH
jgi:tripartite-type tricarboxylate transporter receptor subunit TctC